MPLSHERLCAEIVAQSELARKIVDGADLTTAVPSCPGWNVGQLLRHLGGGQRWATEIVRTHATAPPDDTHFRDLARYANEDPAVLGPWLVESATGLAAVLREAGPDTPMWSPVPGADTTAFYARRFAHETVVHRADAVLALGAEFTLDEAVAIDAIDEWMELGSLPIHFEINPRMRELLGPGRTIALRGTGVPEGVNANWLLDLTGEVITWRRAAGPAAVTVGGPVTELVLLVYRRRPPGSGRVQVSGQADLLDFWLDRVGFG